MGQRTGSNLNLLKWVHWNFSCKKIISLFEKKQVALCRLKGSTLFCWFRPIVLNLLHLQARWMTWSQSTGQIQGINAWTSSECYLSLPGLGPWSWLLPCAAQIRPCVPRLHLMLPHLVRLDRHQFGSMWVEINAVSALPLPSLWNCRESSRLDDMALWAISGPLARDWVPLA